MCAIGAPSDACYRRPALPAAQAGVAFATEGPHRRCHRRAAWWRLLQWDQKAPATGAPCCRRRQPVVLLQEHRTFAAAVGGLLQGHKQAPATGGLHHHPLCLCCRRTALALPPTRSLVACGYRGTSGRLLREACPASRPGRPLPLLQEDRTGAATDVQPVVPAATGAHFCRRRHCYQGARYPCSNPTAGAAGAPTGACYRSTLLPPAAACGIATLGSLPR